MAGLNPLGVLVASQVLGAVGVAGGISAAALLAEHVSGSTALAGLAPTGMVLGAAVTAVPLARLAARLGRRVSLTAGYVAGAAGAGVVVLAAAAGQFWLLMIGAGLFGAGTTANLQSRFAATDDAPRQTRGRRLAVVVWATAAGAVAGPNLLGVGGWAASGVSLPPLAGPYLVSIASFAVAAGVLGRLLPPGRPSPTIPAPPTPAAPSMLTPPAARTAPRPSTVTVLRRVWANRPARLALVAIAGAHASMIAVVAMTPVHLTHEGASLGTVGLVMSLQIAGMFAASPVMGWLTDRAGGGPALGVGALVLLAALAVAGTSAGAAARLAVGLTLLGLGWSCCLIAGSTLLSESVPDDVRIPAQGAADLVMGVCGATAGAAAGPVLAVAGYPGLTLVAAAALLALGGLAAVTLASATLASG